MPTSHGGLTPLGLGLFHPYKKVRQAVAELLEKIDHHPVSPVIILLNIGWPALHLLNE